MDNPKTPPPPPPPPATATSTANRALENFKALLMKCATASTPTRSLSVPHATFIQQRIQQLLPNFPTPHHPPYASMIENAIKQLNVERGSSEEAVSKFILQEYKGLPLAHSTLLKHHLRILCEYGDLVESLDGCYLFGKATTGLKPSSNPTPPLNSVASPSPSLTLSSSPGFSSDFEYASSSTSSSTQSFNLKRKRRARNQMRNDKRKKNKLWKQKARGIKINQKYKEIPGRGQSQSQGQGHGCIQACGQVRGRGRDRSLGRPCKENIMDRENEAFVGQVENKVSMDHTSKIQNLVVENEVTSENIQRQNQDPVNVQSQVEQSTMVIEIEFSGQEERIEGSSSRPSTSTWYHKKKVTSKQGQGSKKGRPKKSIRPKNKPQPGRRQGRPSNKNLQMEETGKNTEPVEATDMGKDKLETDEQSQTSKNQSSRPNVGVILIDDDNVVPECLTADLPPVVEGNMMEGEIEDMLDELIEEVYMEIKQETQYLNNIIDEAAERIPEEEQNQVQRNNLVDSEIQLNENKDEGVKGHNHTSELQDEINEKGFADQTSETSTVYECLDEQQQIEPTMDLGEPQTHEYHGIDLQKHVEMIGQKNLCKEDCPIIEEENHLKYASEVLVEQDQHIIYECLDEQQQIEPTMDLGEPQTHEYHGIDLQKHVEMIGQKNLCKEDCPIIEEENHLKYASEVLVEQDQHIKEPEATTEQNQLEDLHCIIDGEKKDNKEFEIFAELRKLDKETIGKQKQPYTEHNEDQNQQLEEQNQEVQRAELDQQIESSKGMGAEVLCPETFSKVKSVEDSLAMHFPPQPCIEHNENQNEQSEEQNQEAEMTEIDQQIELSKVESVEDSSTIHLPPQPCKEKNENQSLPLEEQNQEVEMTENDQQTDLSKVKSVEDSSTIHFPPQPYIEDNENQSLQLEEQNQELEVIENDQLIELTKVKSVEDSSTIHFPPQPCIGEHNETQSQQEEQNQEVEITENDQQIELSKVKSVEDSSTIHFPPQPYIEQNKNQSQQLEEQNQEAEITENDQQLELSKEMGAEILCQETFSEVKSVEDSSVIHIPPALEQATEKPYCQKLRPRPTKCQLYQEEEQLRIPNVQKSLETNQRKKLRPRSSKSESVSDASVSSVSRPELLKQQEQSTRRSLRPRPARSGI